MVTRRDFIKRLGQAGGVAAAYTAMEAVGLLPAPAAAHNPPQLASNDGAGISVLIIGAGISGLVAAYELSKAGYRVQVLEARDRIGGRNWSVRGGDRVALEGEPDQLCTWETGLYQNVGPARIPSHHQGLLSYCRELGVKLEVQVNTNRNAFIQADDAFGGQAIAARRAYHDLRGHIAELLAKATSQGALNKQLTKEDKERLFECLRAFGDLDDKFAYRGSSRAGYKPGEERGAVAGEPNDPLDLSALLSARFWASDAMEESYDQQPVMLQPAGGMDRIPAAFAKRLGHLIKTKAQVTKIEQTGDGVRATYRHEMSSQLSIATADFCVCALPLSVLRDIDADFTPDVAQAIRTPTYSSTGKLAWEARRFWEQDHHIYGGLTSSRSPIAQLWYPSAELGRERGILCGAYVFGDAADAIAALSMEGRAALGRKHGEAIHPGFGQEVSKPIWVGWKAVARSKGGWVQWTPDDRNGAYKRLLEPDRRVYFAGEHMSYLNAWQEGAVVSAHQTIAALSTRVREQRA